MTSQGLHFPSGIPMRAREDSDGDINKVYKHYSFNGAANVLSVCLLSLLLSTKIMYGVQSVTHLALKAMDPEQPKTSSSLSEDENRGQRSALNRLINLQRSSLIVLEIDGAGMRQPPPLQE